VSVLDNSLTSVVGSCHDVISSLHIDIAEDLKQLPFWNIEIHQVWMTPQVKKYIPAHVICLALTYCPWELHLAGISSYPALRLGVCSPYLHPVGVVNLGYRKCTKRSIANK